MQVAEIKYAGMAVGDQAGITRDGVKELLLLKFAHQRLSDGDEGFELPGLAAKVTELPEALQDGGCLFGETDEVGQIVFGEAAKDIAVQIDDAEDLAAALDHGCGHFAAHFRTQGDITGVGGHIGHQLGAAVKGDPAGDALAETKGNLVVIDRQALLNFNFEFAGVGIEQGDGAGRGAEHFDHNFENGGDRFPWIIHPSGQAAYAVKSLVKSRRVETGGRGVRGGHRVSCHDQQS